MGLNWLDVYADATVFPSDRGHPRVDCSPNRTRDLLSACGLRLVERPGPGGRPYRTAEVHLDGEWMALCWTDLLDDVGVYSVERTSDPEQARARAIAAVRYGARVKRHADGRVSFSVISATSDG